MVQVHRVIRRERERGETDNDATIENRPKQIPSFQRRMFQDLELLLRPSCLAGTRHSAYAVHREKVPVGCSQIDLVISAGDHRYDPLENEIQLACFILLILLMLYKTKQSTYHMTNLIRLIKALLVAEHMRKHLGVERHVHCETRCGPANALSIVTGRHTNVQRSMGLLWELERNPAFACLLRA